VQITDYEAYEVSHYAISLRLLSTPVKEQMLLSRLIKCEMYRTAYSSEKTIFICISLKWLIPGSMALFYN
jgi:hypothetical protein